jgi:hypothetical protein
LRQLGSGGVALHGAELGADQEQHGVLAALPVALGDLRRVGTSQPGGNQAGLALLLLLCAEAVTVRPKVREGP